MAAVARAGSWDLDRGRKLGRAAAEDSGRLSPPSANTRAGELDGAAHRTNDARTRRHGAVGRGGDVVPGREAEAPKLRRDTSGERKKGDGGEMRPWGAQSGVGWWSAVCLRIRVDCGLKVIKLEGLFAK